MLINNMESVCKLFFRGVKTLILKHDQDPSANLEKNLTMLRKKKEVNTRVRGDTNVR